MAIVNWFSGPLDPALFDSFKWKEAYRTKIDVDDTPGVSADNLQIVYRYIDPITGVNYEHSKNIQGSFKFEGNNIISGTVSGIFWSINTPLGDLSPTGTIYLSHSLFLVGLKQAYTNDLVSLNFTKFYEEALAGDDAIISNGWSGYEAADKSKIYAYSGDDIIQGGRRDQEIDGGLGEDTSLYWGRANEYM